MARPIRDDLRTRDAPWRVPTTRRIAHFHSMWNLLLLKNTMC